MTNISTKLKHLVIFPLCALFYFVGAVTVQAATYYVATTGNDARTCATAQTIATPKSTIASGVTCLNPGDTLYIRSGTWTEQIDLQVPNKTGTAGNYITIAGYPGETVTLRYTDTEENSYGPIKARGARGFFIFENLVLDGVNDTIGSGWAIRDGNHDFILRDLEIKNFQRSGLYIKDSPNVTVQQSRIHDQNSATCEIGTRRYGIYLDGGSNVVIEQNDIYNNPGGGIQVYNGQLGAVNGVTIKTNRIHDNNSCTTSHVGGLIVHRATNAATVTNVLVYNNLVYNNGTPTSGNAYGILVNGATGTKILNNTFYKNKSYGIGLGSSPAAVNTVVQNNIMCLNGLGDIFDGGTGSIIDHNLDTDQGFVNAAAFNFNLQTNSPAIDAGVTLSQVRTDIKNTPRPQGGAYDIGAYEAGTGSDSTSPAPPLNLTVN